MRREQAEVPAVDPYAAGIGFHESASTSLGADSFLPYPDMALRPFNPRLLLCALGLHRYSPNGHYLGEYVVAVSDWSEGDEVIDTEGRKFRIVSIDPARVLGAIDATWTVELVR
jgi:hypothetical protein